jgi:RNA polymerase sigma-70 factor, ECF subfamily
VVLTHVDGLSNREAAEALGLPIGTVKSRLHHALRALRAAIDADSRPPQRSERRPT